MGPVSADTDLRPSTLERWPVISDIKAPADSRVSSAGEQVQGVFIELGDVPPKPPDMPHAGSRDAVLAPRRRTPRRLLLPVDA